MSFDAILALILHHSGPSLLFAAGLVASVLVCCTAMLLDSRIRSRLLPVPLSGPTAGYQHFRQELETTSRHLGFTTDEIQDLHDDDFVA